MKNLYIIILLGLSAAAFPQNNVKEIGLRGGYTSGVTFRLRLDEVLSYEAQAGYRNNGSVLTMYRQQHRALGMDLLGNWDLIYGFGAHAGFYFTDRYQILFREVYFGREFFTPVVGMDGYIGIEYQLVEIPVTFGCSFQPYMEISMKKIFGINLWDFGVHMSYRF